MDIPDSVEFECHKCERSASLKAMQREVGRCPKCGADRWRVKVTYHVVEGDDDGQSSLGATVALNALGIGLALTTGQGFVARGRPGGGSRREETATYSEVSGGEILSAYAEGDHGLATLVQRLQQKEADAHRDRMTSRGAKPCAHCGALVVPKPDKLWTLAGACSKVCCAKMLGAERYADIEADVAAKFGAPVADAKAKRLKASVPVECGCGQTYQVPRTYLGARRPCPHCETLNVVSDS